MEDFAGLLGGGSIGALSILYTIWQTKQNTKDIEQLEESSNTKLEEKDKIVDGLVKEFSDFRVHVAEKYVGVQRFVALEEKIDVIYHRVMSAFKPSGG